MTINKANSTLQILYICLFNNQIALMLNVLACNTCHAFITIV